MKDIVLLMIREFQARLKGLGIDFTITDKAVEKIANEGFDPEYSARPLRRSIQKNVEDLLSEELLQGKISKGQKVKVGLSTQGEFIVLP